MAIFPLKPSFNLSDVENAATCRTNLGLGTMATQNATAVAVTGGTIGGLTSFGVRSTGAAFDVLLANSEVLTASRTLSLSLGDAARTLTLSGSPSLSGITTTGTGTLATGTFTLTVSGTATVSQNYTTSGTPYFAGLGIGASPTYSLDILDGFTNAGTKFAHRHRIVSVVTATAANFTVGHEMDMTNSSISAGVTNSSTVVGLRVQNYAGAAGFAGTLTNQYGVWTRSGINAATAGAVVTSSAAVVAEVENNVAGTTIGTAYGVWIQNEATVGTITNRWGLYSDTGTLGSNYFSSSVQIGHTGTALGQLESRKTTGAQIVASNTATTSLSVTVDGTGQASLVTAGTNAGLTLTTTGTGKVILSNCAMNQFQGAAIASAASIDIGAATGNTIDITGTTTITSLGTVQAGTERTLIFAGILTLTHNATSLILPGGANIVTAANKCVTLKSRGSGNWILVSQS